MLTAINSDLPGQVAGHVRENVCDSDTGEHLLIPQGTRLFGLYGHHIAYGQQRVLITWKRLILPDGSSLSLRDGMPGADGRRGRFQRSGQKPLPPHLRSRSALRDQRRRPAEPGSPVRPELPGPDCRERPWRCCGSAAWLCDVGSFAAAWNVSPRLEIRPGFAFNVMITHDFVFPGPYQETSR
jgi:type IV secretion system protein TrbI